MLSCGSDRTAPMLSQKLHNEFHPAKRSENWVSPRNAVREATEECRPSFIRRHVVGNGTSPHADRCRTMGSMQRSARGHLGLKTSGDGWRR